MRNSWLIAGILLVGIAIWATPALAGIVQDSESDANPPDTVERTTFVAWYDHDPEQAGTQLILPLRTDEHFLAGPREISTEEFLGRIDITPGEFTATITLGESIFEAYSVEMTNPENTTFMWNYFEWNYKDEARPATLTMNVRVTAGPYKDREGLATIVSRDKDEAASGVLVIVLNN